MAVALDQKFRRAGECPICEGGDSMKRGRGERCYGYTMRDGNAVVCTREEFAGDIPLNARAKGYVHVLDRPCKCGADHSADYRIEPLRSKPTPTPKAPRQSHLYKTPTEIYSYRDDLRKLRYGHGKTKYFVWQHCDEQGEWWNCDGCDHAPGLYQPTVNAIGPVFLVEGEGKANRIAERGGRAASVPDGALSWSKEYAKILAGEHVVILIDDDDDGRTGAQLEVADLEQIAASVRSLQVEGAHDVADWFADGHTLLELLSIIVCLPSAQNSTFTPQDDPTPGAQKNGCPNCQRWQERAQIAETTVQNLRRDKWREDKIMSIENEKMSAPEKLAALAIGRELSDIGGKEVERNEKGMPRIFRGSIAQRTGVKEKAAGVHMQHVAKAGLFERETDPRFQDTAVFMAPTALYRHPDTKAMPTPERANGWGGRRVKACPHCLSPDIVATSYSCNTCGAHMRPDELISIKVQDSTHAPQDDTPEFSPLEKNVGDLASDGEVFACPECGRQGDMLHDYGDGWLRCRACDVPAERQVMNV